jgi:hypothetical protein
MQHFQNARVAGGRDPINVQGGPLWRIAYSLPDTAFVPAAKGVIRKKECRSFHPFIQSADCRLPIA